MLISKIVSITMLLWALYPENPYGYYVLLRIVLFIVCIFFVIDAKEKLNTPMAVAFGITGIIYNPVISIHLTREIWTVINVLTVFLFGLEGFLFRKPNGGTDEQE
ncbi:hypothetical protein Dalk_5229 [Desulfatibacillum aliphaticivorans]|uniref:Uncharacterized protein n=1 Tax=Desulfatibacillum aliphaticivorans TaxID=218208 RepID=B8FEB8_DESAL|nr:DUF6804 family protein [Desulfatibacillum aliphaticivorans]ACL06899.1 hypothetical protein Dalk_5229 [Desulfatibacillum aliphaticivorans]